MSFTDAALTQSSTNVYTIRAVDGAGNVGPVSSPVTVVYDVTAPTIPGLLTAATPTNWNLPCALVGRVDGLRRSGVDHYDVFRGSTKVEQLAVTGLGFTDTSPVTGKARDPTLVEKAIDAAGEHDSRVHRQDRGRARPDPAARADADRALGDEASTPRCPRWPCPTPAARASAATASTGTGR